MDTKKCSKCKKFKDTIEFGKDKNRKDNLCIYCKDCKNIKSQEYKLNNKDKIKESGKIYRKNNKTKIQEYNRKYSRKNKDKRTEYQRNYLFNNINAKITNNLRSRLNGIIGRKKSGSAVRDLGCYVEKLKEHLENKFYPHPETGEKMTWDNRGKNGWHIDHIIPLASFDLADRKQFLKACHYTNLQPLWAEDNLKKAAK